MALLLVIGLALVGVSLVLVAAALRDDAEASGVGRSLALIQAMGSAPSELTQELDRPFSERVLEPLQERALRLGRRLTGADSAERIRRKLDLAGNPAGWSVDRVVSAKVIGAVSFCLVGFAGSLLLGVSRPMLLLLTAGALALGFFAPNLYLYQVAYNRAAQLQRGLPDAIDLLTISVESGLGFDAALQQVARNTDGPLAEEFSRVLREIQIGQGRAGALRAMAERTTVPDVRSFVGAMVQADGFGIPIAQVLRVQSQEIRVKRRQRAEEKAQKVPVKMTVPLIVCIMPCLFVVVMGPAVLSIMENF